MPWFRRTPQKREAFADDVLGHCTPCESGWTAKIVREDNSFQLELAGAREPDAALLAHAREIVNNYPSFRKMVMDRIELESSEYPPDARAEVAGLEIEDIFLRAPGKGMIFFRGSPADIGLWRFDYVGGKPTGLGCDT